MHCMSLLYKSIPTHEEGQRYTQQCIGDLESYSHSQEVGGLHKASRKFAVTKCGRAELMTNTAPGSKTLRLAEHLLQFFGSLFSTCMKPFNVGTGTLTRQRRSPFEPRILRLLLHLLDCSDCNVVFHFKLYWAQACNKRSSKHNGKDIIYVVI